MVSMDYTKQSIKRVMYFQKELGIVICSGSVLQVDHVTLRV